MSWDLQYPLSLTEVTRREVDDAFERMLVRFDRGGRQHQARDENEAAVLSEDDARAEGHYLVSKAFSIRFHRCVSACWFSTDSQWCASSDSDEALRCMNLWAEELGATLLDDAEWASRREALGYPDEVPLGSLTGDDDTDDELKDLSRGPPSSTLVVLKDLEDQEITQFVFPGASQKIPEGYRSDLERMKSNVRSIAYTAVDAEGLELSYSTTHFDPYGRQLPLER